MFVLTALLDFLGRHATRVFFVAVILALGVPGLADFARPLLLPGLVVPLVIALIRLDWSAVWGYGRRTWLVAGLLLWLMVAAPVLMAMVTAPFAIPEGIRAGLVLMAAASPMVSAPAFALLYGLDAALAVVISVTGTLLVPLTLPPLALGLLGLDVNVPMDVLMGRLGLLVVLPFLVALGIRRFVSQAWIRSQSRRLDGVTVLVLLLFVLGMMAGVGDLMWERPGYVAAVTLAAFGANLGLHAVGTLVWWLAGRKPALTIGFCTGNRNMGLVLVSLADRAPPEVLIFFALSQFPMYMLPALLVATYRRLDPPAIQRKT